MAALLNNRLSQFVPLLVGQGKLAQHLAFYFSALSLPFETLPSARNLRDDLNLNGALNRVNAIWILVSDQAIESVKNQFIACAPRFPMLTSLPIIHSSAASDISETLTVHPLQTFGPEVYPLEVYKTIPFVFFKRELNDKLVEEHALIQKQLRDILPNPQFEISNSHRALYHAYCVMMANFPQILWSAVIKDSKAINENPSALFGPILKQATENFLNLGETALTGPLVRGDLKTIENHKRALVDSALLPLYQSFEVVFKTVLKKENP